jgi:hypothetical protein
LSDTGSITIPTTATSTVGNLVTTSGVYWSNGAAYSSGGSGSGTPGGANTMVQFNNGGSFAGATYLQYNITSGNLVSNSTTAATSTTTGALVIGGGVGVSGGLYVGGVVTATNIFVGSSPVLTTANFVNFGVASIAGATGTVSVNTGTNSGISITTGTNSLTFTSTETLNSITTRGNVTTNTITHGGLVPSSGLNIDQIYSTSTIVTLTKAWQNTGVSGSQLTIGSYMVQLLASDSGVGGGEVNMYYTGMMSWYPGNGTETSYDEITLHRAGSAAGTGTVFLQVLRTNGAAPTLQIAGTTNNSGTSTYSMSFRRMI